MSINLFQAILIGLWTAFCFSGMLLGMVLEERFRQIQSDLVFLER